MKPLAKTRFLTAFLWLCFMPGAYGQIGNLRLMKEKKTRLEKIQDYRRDTSYLNVVNQIAFLYAGSYPDSALKILEENTLNCERVSYEKGQSDGYKIKGNAYTKKGDYINALSWYRKSYEIAEKIGYKTALPGIRNNIGLAYTYQGNYTAALNEFYAALQSAEEAGDQFVMGSTLNNFAIVHFYQGKMIEADSAYKRTLEIAKKMSDTIGIILAYNNIAEVNIEQNALSLALKNLNLAHVLSIKKGDPEMLTIVSHSLGSTYFKLDSLDKAAAYFKTAVKTAKKYDYSTSSCRAQIGLARVYVKQGLLREALTDGLDALQLAKKMGHTQLLRDANEIVSVIYDKMGDAESGLVHYKEFKIYSDSLRNLESERIATMFDAKLEFSKKEDDLKRRNIQQEWMIFSSLAALLLLGGILILVNRNRKKLNDTYNELRQKNTVIESQRKIAEETLDELKSTQAQLIQAEKMASLGELTAGVAHEIQNPLNFVNNFSEISIELLDEMKDELDKGHPDEAKELVADITSNLEKINQHGKRADSIVKGMLQHSRSSSGQKEPTDINRLIDEYILLSYYGLRAKDKSFDAKIDQHFDQSLEKIMLIPQDMGRVILNLLNNAFYAVHEKHKSSADQDYNPTVKVTTQKEGDKVVIQVSDNGNGMSDNIRSKVFQPFFTTKPTGQGTGLGLSLSYDIVSKGFGGKMTVESKEGEGTVFTIILKG